MLLLAASPAGGQALVAQPIERAPLPRGEVLADEVVIAAELEGDERPPVYVFRTGLALALRTEMVAAGTRDPLRALPTLAQTQAIIEQAVAERLLEREAWRAVDPVPTDEAVEEERAELLAAMGMIGGLAAVLRASGADETEFDNLVRRRVVVLQFLVRHLPRTIEPTEQDLRAAYDSERIEPFRARGVPFAVARRDIRLVLLREGYPRAVRSYLRSLGSRARIRVWASSSSNADG